MATPYVEELALESRNNEGISEIITITAEVDGIDVPVDLTGRTFFAQARTGKNKTADLLCEIEVMIEGDPTEGRVLLTVDDAIMRDVPPVKGHYDVLMRSETGYIDNLYMAPFLVGTGVSDPDQWL